MGASFDNQWSSDNKEKPQKKISTEIKSPEKHQLHFAKEKRRGKVVTIVKPFHLATNDLKALLKTIKKKIGTGGAIKEDGLEFQGEVRENLYLQLKNLGYHFK